MTMPERQDTVAAMVEHFDLIYRQRMRELPIVNRELTVEAVGFEPLGEHMLGILVTPWFMNLVLLPGTDEWTACEQGERRMHDLPGDRYEFTVTHDETLGTYLSAVMFRAVTDFPDQDTARAIGIEILRRVRSDEAGTAGDAAPAGQQPEPARPISRREFFSRLRSDNTRQAE